MMSISVVVLAIFSAIRVQMRHMRCTCFSWIRPKLRSADAGRILNQLFPEIPKCTDNLLLLWLGTVSNILDKYWDY